MTPLLGIWNIVEEKNDEKKKPVVLKKGNFLCGTIEWYFRRTSAMEKQLFTCTES